MYCFLKRSLFRNKDSIKKSTTRYSITNKELYQQQERVLKERGREKERETEREIEYSRLKP